VAATLSRWRRLDVGRYADARLLLKVGTEQTVAGCPSCGWSGSLVGRVSIEYTALRALGRQRSFVRGEAHPPGKRAIHDQLSAVDAAVICTWEFKASQPFL
jgi:hypothetical protein